MNPHKGRTYAVSGAASGIGAAIVRSLRERGGRVMACDLGEADVVAISRLAKAGRPWSTA